jgi:PII interaction protein X
MSNEIYLNHPTFGLLYRVCLLEEQQEIFTTLYAQRLFFLVKTTAQGTAFESISRSDARLLVESHLRKLRRTESMTEYQALYAMYQRTFQS